MTKPIPAGPRQVTRDWTVRVNFAVFTILAGGKIEVVRHDPATSKALVRFSEKDIAWVHETTLLYNTQSAFDAIPQKD